MKIKLLVYQANIVDVIKWVESLVGKEVDIDANGGTKTIASIISLSHELVGSVGDEAIYEVFVVVGLDDAEFYAVRPWSDIGGSSSKKADDNGDGSPSLADLPGVE